MLSLNDFLAKLSVVFQRPIGPLNEIKRALSEQTKAFEDGIFEEAFADAAAAIRGASSVDADVLAAKSGPGGGVKADAFRAAFFTIAAAIDGPRASAGTDTWHVWHLPQAGSVLAGWGDDWTPTFANCELTGCHLFGEAFKVAISNPDIARRVKEVRMATEGGFAEIHFDNSKISRFEFAYKRGPHFAYNVAVLTGTAIQLIAGVLAPSLKVA